METTADAGPIRKSRARLPTQGRGEALLFLGPGAVYLAVKVIYLLRDLLHGVPE